MIFRRFIVLLVSPAFIACASVHPGKIAKVEHQRIPAKVSGKPINYWNGETFQLVEITIENTSEQWMRIVRSDIVIDDPSTSKTSVIVGEDLKGWAQAMHERAKLEDYNKSMTSLGVAAVGILAMAAGAKSNSDLKYIGAATTVGAAVYDGGRQISRDRNAAQESNRVPESHLYQPFSIPGKMFQRRWIVLNKPAKMKMQNLVVELENIEGQKDRYEIKLY